MDWSQQVQVYVSWVNSQLRKSPNTSVINELRDPRVCDGTVLAHLVELISGQNVPGIEAQPSNAIERLANIEKLLSFMQAHKVKMHAIEAQAVVDGDLKSIMRIVLALAAHFKPRSVRPNHSLASIMQGAAVSLANTKHQVLRSPSIGEKRFDFSIKSPSSEYRTRLPACRDVDEEGEAEERGRPKAIPLTPRARSVGSTPSLDTPSANEADSGCHVTPCSVPVLAPLAVRAEAVGPGLQDAQAPDITEDLLSELGETRSLLEELQSMLLGASLSADSAQKDEAPTESGDSTAERESAKNQRTEDRLHSLEEELRQRDERLFSHEFRLRQSIIRSDAVQEEAAELRKRLAEKEAAVAAQQQQTERLQRHVASLSRDLELAVEERCRLSRDLARSSDERERVSRDLHERISELECRVLRPLPTSVSNSSAAMADLEHRTTVFGECVERLRSSLAANDPLHHTLDQLEHCFHYQASAVLTAPSAAPTPPPRSISARRNTVELIAQPRHRWRVANRPASLELTTRDVKRQPITALQGFPVQRLDLPLEEDERSTRLLYYTDKTVNPYMVSIPKRLKEIRLADVRRATAQHVRSTFGVPRLRYLFKTHDPEFGTAVKEEVRHDDDFVPVWEDKIIAWITDIPETLPPHT